MTISSACTAKRPIPCVGISFGIDRIYTLLDVRREKKPSALTHEIDVYVMAFGGKDFGGLLPERMSIARLLWNAGIRAEFSAKVIPKLTQQFKAAKDVPLAVILGEDELAAGQVRLKALGSGDDEAKQKDRGLLIYKKDLIKEVKKLLTAIV